MKLTRAKLTRLIKEELGGFLKEAHAGEKLAAYWGGRSPEEKEEEAERLQHGMEKNMGNWFDEPEGGVRGEVEELLADLGEDELQEVRDFLRDLAGTEEEEEEQDPDDPWAGYESKWKE